MKKKSLWNEVELVSFLFFKAKGIGLNVLNVVRKSYSGILV